MGDGERLAMPNLLAPTNLFGKHVAGEAVSQSLMGVDVDFEALRNRVEIAWKLSGLSQRALSRKAKRSDSFVESILNRRSKSPEVSGLRAIALAANVDPDWLLIGKGQPRPDTTVDRDPRYVALEAARTMGRAAGMNEAFVSEFDVALDADEQPDPDYLWTLMKAAWARQQRKTSATGDPLADLDPPKRRPPTKP